MSISYVLEARAPVYSLYNPRGLTSLRIYLLYIYLFLQSCPYSPLFIKSPYNITKIYIKEVFIRYRALSKIILDRDLRFIGSILGVFLVEVRGFK